MNIAFGKKERLPGGWGDYVAIAPDGKRIAAATTGRLFVWESDHDDPKIILLPGFQKSPLIWNTGKKRLDAGSYKIDLATLSPVAPVFQILALMSAETGIPSDCLVLDCAAWNAEGNRLFFQAISVPSKNPDLKDREVSSKTWTGIVDGYRGCFINGPKEADFFKRSHVLCPVSTGFVSGGDGFLNLYDDSSGLMYEASLGSERSVRAVSEDLYRNRIALTTQNGMVLIWDTKNKRIALTFDAGRAESAAVCCFHIQSGLLCVGNGPEVGFWSIEDKATKKEVVQTDGDVQALAISDQGKRMVVASGTGGARIEVLDLI
jgi:WD40 repeat protein